MMKINNLFALILLSVILILSSCVSRKKLTYLQYSGHSMEYELPNGDVSASVTPQAYKVMPYDNLYIRVITPDPQWSTLFNVDVGTSGLTQESAALSGYNVDANGDIEIPFVGKVNVGEKTLSEVKENLDSIFKNYVTDAMITVRLVNNNISIIGEVRSPGRYLITKDRLTIFEALSLAGDLNEYGDRQKVQLIRPSRYGPIVKEFSLADRSILASEFYYVMPNDVIYAIPMQGRSYITNSSIYTLFLSTITTALVLLGYLNIL